MTKGDAAISNDCRFCGAPLATSTLDFGPIPLCNRFSATPAQAPTHAMALAECSRCELVQLVELPDIATLAPRIPGLRYNEPEGHLDALVDRLDRELFAEAMSVVRPSVVGLGPFEAPLLNRLAARGAEVCALDLLAREVAPDGVYPYLETWQDRLRSHEPGSADLVSCRYLFEHCQQPLQALQGLKARLRPGGALLLEIPDSAKFLAATDYSFPWEEHVSYFTEPTFARALESAGFETVAIWRYPGRLEDALVGVFRVAQGQPVGAGATAAPKSDLFARYRDAFPDMRARARRAVDEIAGGAPGSVALFGLGHQALTFVHAMGLADRIAFACDDAPNKLGTYPPGLRIPVIGSEALLSAEGVRLCLLAVNPNAEPRVREKLQPLAARGVEMRSIYADTPTSIFAEIQRWA